MADFRRVVLALAVLAVFAGLAGAQTTTNVLQCNASVVPPQLRSEGVTENMGDIVLSCSAGATTTPGLQIPPANFVVYTNTTVTSRLLAGTNGTASEALLLVDEPGSGLGGYGPAQPVTPCQTPLTGCVAYAAAATFGGNPTVVPVTTSGGTTPAPNMFFGIVSGSSVTFNGVPVLAPGSTGSRVYRITNIRVNTSGITGGTLPGSVIADVAISGSTSVNVNNSALTTGYVAQSLKTGIRDTGDGSSFSPTALQCSSVGGSGGTKPAIWGYLRYTKLFGSAWKTRVNPSATNAGAGAGGSAGAAQSSTAEQNVPGYIYTAETDFTPYVGTSPVYLTGASVVPGLADYGTRVKAVFSNIPNGVSIYVAPTSSTDGGVTGSTSVILIPSATYLYGTGTLVGLTATSGSYTQLAISNGSAQAVWEVVGVSTSSVGNIDIPVAISYTANPGSNLPAVGTATVNLEYAPVASDIGGTITSASSSQPIPRFIDTSSASNFIVTGLCTTSMLFPFVTNQSGFDTGLAISNTSVDPFGTAPQAGTCTLNWYGASAPAKTVTSSVAGGTTWAGLTSLLAPGFQGYMIATCNFQYAHGFAFISDLGARNLAMGYLALIMDSSFGTRTGSSAETLEN